MFILLIFFKLLYLFHLNSFILQIIFNSQFIYLMNYCKLFTLLGFLALFNSAVLGQEDGKYNDFLTSEFHKERREALRQMMPQNSVAVFFSNPVRNRANDVDYVYHQDPNFFYLTGHKEPHSLLMIFKSSP